MLIYPTFQRRAANSSGSGAHGRGEIVGRLASIGPTAELELSVSVRLAACIWVDSLECRSTPRAIRRYGLQGGSDGRAARRYLARLAVIGIAPVGSASLFSLAPSWRGFVHASALASTVALEELSLRGLSASSLAIFEDRRFALMRRMLTGDDRLCSGRVLLPNGVACRIRRLNVPLPALCVGPAYWTLYCGLTLYRRACEAEVSSPT